MKYKKHQLRRPRPLFSLFLVLFLTSCTAPSPSPFPLITASPISEVSPFSSPTPSLPLRAPNPILLLRVLNYGISLERDAWAQFDYPTFHGDFLTSPEARGLFDFVQADLDRYYPTGLPNAGEMFTDGSLDPNIWLPPRAVWTLAQAGVVEFLRASEATLTSGELLHLDPFTLITTQLELDGDPGSEWLVEVTSEVYNLHGWLPLDERVSETANNSLGYTLIPSEIQHENLTRAQGTTLHIAPDLNGDGLEDLLVQFDGQVVGTQFGYLKVYGRVDTALSLLDTIQLKPGEIFEVPNELRISIPRSLNFECTWTQTNLYQWTGRQKAYSVINEGPPDTPLCNAALALSPLSNLSSNERATLLENAIATLTAETVPSEDYLALLYLHLQMAYAAQGIEVPVFYSTEFNKLQGGFAEDIRSTEHGARGRLWPICNALYRDAKLGRVDVGELATYLSPSAMFSAYGNTLTSSSSLVCPLQMLIDNQLETLQLVADVSPDEQEIELGIFLEQLSAYPLDQDSEDEWIGLLDLETPRILLFDQEEAYWKIHSIAQFDAPLGQLQTHVTDFNEDNQPDILLLATLGPTVPISQFPKCWEKGSSQVSELRIISTEIWEAGTKTVLCGEPPLLTTIPAEQLQEFTTEEPPQLPTLANPRTFYQFLEQQEAQIFAASSQQGVRTALETILFESVMGFPDTDRIIPRLLFDIGLSYEIERDTAAARSAYLDLMAQWPNSPWAWLAEARVSD